MLQSAILLIFPACMIIAAVYDISTMTIPNWISVVLVAGFVVLIPFMDVSWATLGLHFAVGFGILIAGFMLFSVGLVGGGDAKLLAVSALWVGWSTLLPYVVWVTLAGGAFAFLILTFRNFPLPYFLVKQSWVARLHEPGGSIPYGVALAVGGLVAFVQSPVFSALAV